MWEPQPSLRETKAALAGFYEGSSSFPLQSCGAPSPTDNQATYAGFELPNFSKFKAAVSGTRDRGPSYLRVRQRGNTSRKQLEGKGNNRYKGPRVEADTNLVTLCSSKYFARSASSMSRTLFSKTPLKGISTAPGSFLSTHSFILINLLQRKFLTVTTERIVKR